MDGYKCSVCGYVYNPSVGEPEQAIDPGVAFEDLARGWNCPVCLASKEMFRKEQTTDDEQGTGAPSSEAADIEDRGGPSVYRVRFENLSRVVQKITSSLSIGTVLEVIRDQARSIVPNAREACLLIVDPEALHYTRPLHCAVHKERLNCQLCKRGRKTIEAALEKPLTIRASGGDPDLNGIQSGGAQQAISEISLPILDDKEPLGLLHVAAKSGHGFDDRDLILLKDLANLARNAIVNAREHWKMAKEKHTMDSILTHLKPFVPQTVQRVVEKDPFDPSLEKRDVDVSILFLDIAGYTKMSESMSRDKVNFVIEKYFSSFLDIIYEWEGDINETAGDGLMVIFQGEAAKNAVSAARASLAIHGRTLEINEELEGRFAPVDVNMGINSGIASVGVTRFNGSAGLRMTFTATGPVTNLSARIASAAVNGDVLIGPETARRIGTALPLHDRGIMQFKNVKEGCQVFSLVRPQ